MQLALFMNIKKDCMASTGKVAEDVVILKREYAEKINERIN